MREIKFRAWDEKTKKMFKPSSIDAYGTIVVDVMHAPGETHPEEYPNPYTLMQFTGLHDKNGKEIFEGDVVLRLNKKSEVRWRADCVMFDGLDPAHASKYEVIGNVYENPELLR